MSNLKVSTRKLVELQDWNNFVREVYGKPYNLQQQDGCMERGVIRLNVPSEYTDDYEDELPDDSDYDAMGVSFETWLNTTPEQVAEQVKHKFSFQLEMYLERKFYPSLDMIADNLFNRGLIEAGEYSINIDW